MLGPTAASGHDGKGFKTSREKNGWLNYFFDGRDFQPSYRLMDGQGILIRA